MKDRWIVVNRWGEFQHYKDRRPVWIKNNIDLLDQDAYLELPGNTRSVLHGLWIVYARTRGEVREDTAWLSGTLRQRVTKQQLESLNQAGFIRFVASKPLAKRYYAASLTRARAPARTEQEQEQQDRKVQATTTSPQEPTLPVNEEMEKLKLLETIGADASNGTLTTLEKFKMPPAAWAAARERVMEHRGPIIDRAAYVCGLFKAWKEEGRYA